MSNTIAFKVGLDAISSYKRLAYTPWHALAEFIDNSTQNFFNHRAQLEPILKSEGKRLEVRIVYDREAGSLVVTDNSIGMNFEELQHALHVGKKPAIQTGRSRYGLGLKTAACWIGNLWTIRTKRLGETLEHRITVDVDAVAGGQQHLPYATEERNPNEHYTHIEITRHNQIFQGRSLGKIKKFLGSFYREDFRNGVLHLEFQGEPLSWAEFDDRLYVAPDGSKYKLPFEFEVDKKTVRGWIGVLAKGSRADAGFAMIHSGRVVKGYPDAWRPQTIFGQFQGSNDLVNQRLIGEVHLDHFEVNHTKDDILWIGSQEDDVEDKLLEIAKDYREKARTPRKGEPDERGPSPVETQAAIEQFKQEITSPEFVDKITLSAVPDPEIAEAAMKRITDSQRDQTPTFEAKVPLPDKSLLLVKGYIDSDLSPNDPYVAVDSARPNEVIVTINQQHPHWADLNDASDLLNYLRDSTYDGIAEWRSRQKIGQIVPDTVKLIKDQLLRVSCEIEMHSQNPAPDQPSSRKQ
jgi:hypothetical protein